MPDLQMPVKPLQAIFYRDWANSHIPEILEEVYLKNVYAPYLMGKKLDVIVDIGSNQGLTLNYFSAYAKRVIGLEPNKIHRETAQHMLDFNKITNVEILPYGISNKHDRQKFYLHDNSTMYSLTQLGQNIPFEEIETITIDELFIKGGIKGKIDMIKLDCEGEESKVITSESFKKNVERMPLIAGEWHNWTSMSQGQFMQQFRDLGYTFHWLRNTQAQCFVAQRV